MSWRGRNGGKDPFEKPVVAGQRLGTFEVVGLAYKDPHAGVVAQVKCVHCGAHMTRVMTKLRHEVRSGGAKRHRGCKANRGAA